MTWLRRITEGILTKTVEKKEAPDGLWMQCKSCKKTITQGTFDKNLHVCLDCGHHHRISSAQYFSFLFDRKYRFLFSNLVATDFLNFTDLKSYAKRLEETRGKTGLNDAIQIATGKIGRNAVVVACMDFSFIGGSMGSVVGEKISKAIDFCIRRKRPLVIISKSGGARMMESAFSLMQMAKTSAKLSLLAEASIPYISVLTDPTTGGVSASFAMLGDINIAEPKALIGFAGPRVIKETIKKDLPPGFQRSEFLLEKGFVDIIVERQELKQTLAQLLTYFKK